MDTTLKAGPVEILQPVPVCTVPHDGIYLFTLNIKIKDDNTDYKADVLIEMNHNRAFLSAVDWPLLPVNNIGEGKSLFLIVSFHTVLWCYVPSICCIGYYMVSCVFPTMA